MIGIGTDILSIERIFSIKKPIAFASRILSESELVLFKERYSKNESVAMRYLARRFCAKEAISKAIRTGIGRDGLSFNSICIDNDSLGAPIVYINDILRADILLSISDEDRYVVAFAIKK